MLKSVGLAVVVLTVTGSCGSRTGSAAQAQETVQSMLAAQIRTQGFVCDTALGAVRDAKRSKPDRAMWVLKRSNANYRISRVLDMVAKVEVVQ